MVMAKPFHGVDLCSESSKIISCSSRMPGPLCTERQSYWIASRTIEFQGPEEHRLSLRLPWLPICGPCCLLSRNAKHFQQVAAHLHCQGDEGHTLSLRRGQISSLRMVHEMSHWCIGRKVSIFYFHCFYPHIQFMHKYGFPCDSADKEFACSAGDFGHLMRRADSLKKTLILGRIEGRRRRGHQSTRWLDGITESTDMHLSKLWEIVEDRGASHATVLGVWKNQTGLGDRRATKTIFAHKRVVTTHLSLYQWSFWNWILGLFSLPPPHILTSF